MVNGLIKLANVRNISFCVNVMALC